MHFYHKICEKYKGFFSAAAELGAPYVIMHGAKHGADICDEEYAERFTRLGEIAMTFGCFMAHENVVDFSGQRPELMKLLKSYGKENFKMVLDVKQARKANNLTQEQLGKRIGVQKARISRLERGKKLLLESLSKDGYS